MISDFTADDVVFMSEAICLAWESAGHTRPNPPVGAVVVKNGKIIGRGRHVKCGLDHAEAAALKNCEESPEGAVLYCTLEPCSKKGRVGACTDAIIAAKISKVVWACDDPNPVNRLCAAKIFEDNGIGWGSGLLKNEAEQLILPFKKHVTQKLPFVTVKLAMSLDGKICDNEGDAKWISSSAARGHTGLYRERCDAIMVGAQTVRADNPSLLSHGKANDDLIRVVISETGNLPKDAQIFIDGAKNKTLVMTPSKMGGLRGVMEELGKMNVMHVLCEGGMKLALSLYEEGLVDEWVSVLSPVIIGNKPISESKRGQMISLMPCEEKDVIARWKLCSRD
ncbi:MAG: bifunctional diaminohydroxyphosphoribosylaminopyrimidine deaminase/5-amino-6-(5-phosphoribosylamino)uracil reductase RibD [Kiritimatiellae bacterium]|nr:bifunctional diaminohydroxyphosphoribosylaminopyrimidine deaminase/5-amino-6-(5-phosphoribosylamino)uracil reductase RibD [Kiritimatiellia bacterium]